MLPTPGKIKKDMAWDKESMYAFWDVVCISFMSMVLVVNAITSNLQSEIDRNVPDRLHTGRAEERHAYRRNLGLRGNAGKHGQALK